MTKTQRSDPATIARLIETDELIRYAVEELGGQITAIRNSPATSLSHLDLKAARYLQDHTTYHASGG